MSGLGIASGVVVNVKLKYLLKHSAVWSRGLKFEGGVIVGEYGNKFLVISSHQVLVLRR